MPTPPALDLSVSAEADRYFAGFHDHRNMSPVVGIFQHSLQTFVVLENVYILEGNLTPGEILTGPRCIGSEVLSEYEYFFRCHNAGFYSSR